MTLLLGYKKQLVEDKYDLDQLMLIAQQKVDETVAGSLLLKSNNTIRIPSLMHTGTWRGKIGIQLRFGPLPFSLPYAPKNSRNRTNLTHQSPLSIYQQ
jgi:hypothetical protein